MTDAIVQFQNVTKLYGGAPAVDGLDLAIGRGQFVTLLGPSGCGKSTTLRMLGGFETPTSGTILLSGRDVTHLPPNRRPVNIVFQDYALFPHLTVAKNIAFGLELKGMDSAAIARRVGELLDLVQLGDFAGRMPAQLSGGQRQRVALMRALAPDPEVLLLDEPLSALDAKLRQQMQIELKSIQRETGKTFLFVTHDQEEALTMSDQVVVMNRGRIEQMGAPEALYRRPASRFVADFIGEANFLSGRVLGVEGGEAVLDWAGERIVASFDGPAPRPGEARSVVVRPESLWVRAAPPADAAPGGFAGRARVVRRIFKGANTVLTLRTAAGQELEAQLAPLALAGLAGDEVWFGWNGRDAVLLAERDEETA